MIRATIAALALLTASAAVPQSLTLTNLKGPIARICDQKPATSIANLWKQINACRPTPTPSPTPTPTPSPAATPITPAIRAALLVKVPVPPSSDPEPIGNFRFICTPGPMNYDDAILYPGQIGGSLHLHQNYGNTLIDGRSTHESLLSAGESTCSNILNRSAYWVPALLTGDGKHAIRPDWINIYYKRLPAGDPMCLKQAAKGCVGIPDGLRVVSGYDMKRMHQAQPENETFTHRCASDGKPSIHRKLLAEAVADCGGAGQIVSAIRFGECWSGTLDSPDHRSHLVWAKYDGITAYPKCPATHPYMLPELSQLVAYTIEKSDGDIHFSSDRMPGTPAMPAGSTFHGDYIEAWDKPTRLAWEGNCIDKKLNCSDGVLGDGTMLKRPALTYKANPRLVPVPARPI